MRKVSGLKGYCNQGGSYPASYAGIGTGLVKQMKVAWALSVKAKAIH